MAGNGYFIASYVIQNPSLFGATAGPELANKRRYRQPSYAIFSSQLNRTAPGGHYTIGVYAEDLTDKRYTIIRSGGAFGDYSQYNEPRTHGIRAGFKY